MVKIKTRKKEDWTEAQADMFMSFFHGIIFTLSLLFFLELPNILLNTSKLWRILIICLVILPILTWINYNGIRYLAYRWSLAKQT